MEQTNKGYDCHCWNDYPNENHRYYGCSDAPKKSGKWKCVDCYEYVGKSKFGATHCRKKAGDANMNNNKNIVIAQSLMMRIKDYTERALNEKDVTLDVAMAEIRHTVDAYDEYFQTGRKPQ